LSKLTKPWSVATNVALAVSIGVMSLGFYAPSSFGASSKGVGTLVASGAVKGKWQMYYCYVRPGPDWTGIIYLDFGSPSHRLTIEMLRSLSVPYTKKPMRLGASGTNVTFGASFYSYGFEAGYGPATPSGHSTAGGGTIQLSKDLKSGEVIAPMVPVMTTHREIEHVVATWRGCP
jgi:hypothetical protein